MKLYYSPGACSLSPHIVLRELGLPFELDKLDMKTKKTDSGADFMTINPKGYVPVLGLDSGDVLTEGAIIVQYLADQKPEAGMAAKPGTMERVRLQEMLNYIAAELHKAFGPLFTPGTSDEARKAASDAIAKRLSYLETVFADGRDYLTGANFSVADAYLFTILNWTGFVKIDLAPWPKLAAFYARTAARPKVREALVAEGLAKAS